MVETGTSAQAEWVWESRTERFYKQVGCAGTLHRYIGAGYRQTVRQTTARREFATLIVAGYANKARLRGLAISLRREASYV